MYHSNLTVSDQYDHKTGNLCTTTDVDIFYYSLHISSCSDLHVFLDYHRATELLTAHHLSLLSQPHEYTVQ